MTDFNNRCRWECIQKASSLVAIILFLLWLVVLICSHKPWRMPLLDIVLVYNAGCLAGQPSIRNYTVVTVDNPRLCEQP